MSAGERSLRFAPATGRQQEFTISPLDWINGHNIDVAVKTPVLKSIIEYKDVAQLCFLGECSGFVPACADQDRNIAQPLFHEKRLIAPFLPVPLLAPNDHNSSADSSITARQNHWLKSAIAQCFCQRNHERRLSGTSNREVPDTDDGMLQPHRLQNACLVKLLPCPKHESEGSAHLPAPAGSRILSTRSTAPVFC